MSDDEREQAERERQPLEAERKLALLPTPGPMRASGATDLGGNAATQRWFEGPPAFRSPHSTHRALALQRTAGNAATAQVLQRDWFDDLSRGPWDALFVAQADPGLPRSLIRHYQAGGGTTYTLSRAEMIEIDAATSVFERFATIRAERNRLLTEASANTAGRTDWEVQITGARGLAAARKNQTLGNFTVEVSGTLRLHKGRYGILAEFEGTAKYIDYWDFDPKPYETFVTGESNRTAAGEIKTWVGATMDGTPFNIESGATVDITQHQFDTFATIR